MSADLQTTRGTAPDVLVVAATHNRAELLPRLVRGLEAQVGAPAFEVVIVDDCSSDDTPSVLAELARASSLPLQWFRQERRAGPAPARNRGWRASPASRVLFTDDDCVPHTDWVATLLAALDDHDFVQGTTIPAPDQLQNSGVFSRTLEVREPSGTFQTCNMGYRRTWLEKVDGFDEAFDQPAGEDTDLALRCLDQGASFAFCAEAVVEHDVRPSSFRAALKDTWRWRGVVGALARHPELHELIGSRWFWKPSHPRAIAATVGLATGAGLALRGRPIVGLAVAAAANAPYAQYRVRRDPIVADKAGRVRYLPHALAIDMGEVVALAEGSRRYRKLVL
ncbi:MAG TPA: glycosyltransferase [Acidimicrobiales bacterium]|jgi:glycosyltransferase involved in cell wall biosynthesis|nr:glycosyltransferase [Acidimicrobiales bacterium]